MTELEPLLELREKIKEKKPYFIRQDYQRRKRLGRKLKWRKPKGIHSKIRHKFKGRRKMPSPGYKSPKKVIGLHSSGSKIVNISSLEDIEKISKEIEGMVISKKVGIKKKLEILRKAKEYSIKVLNLNVYEQIKKIEYFINSKKKITKETKKEEIKEEKETKMESPKEKIQMIDEDKKQLEKKEKEKILTKKV